MISRATRLIRFAVLSATLAVFVAVSPMSSASDKAPMKNGPSLTAKEATELIGTAKTAKDHQKLANYFSHQAHQSDVDAKVHEAMIEAYRKSPGGAGMIEHCESIVKANQDMAKAYRAMAAGHEETAKNAK